MGRGDPGQFAERRNSRQDGFGQFGMLPDGRPFLVVELAGLVEDGIGYPELADVVQQRPATQPAAPGRVQPQFRSEHVRIERDARAVSSGIRALGVDHVTKRGRNLVHVLFVERNLTAARRKREYRAIDLIGGQHVPERPVVGQGIQDRNQFRIEPAAGSPARLVERGARIAGGVKDVDHLRQQCDPRV